MAKPLGAKSRLIREAITANPAKGNTELATLINVSDARKLDKIEVSANDVAAQRQALKKANQGAAIPAAKPTGKKRGRPAKAKAEANHAAQAPTPRARQANPADLIDRLFELADEVGGLGQLKRLVDRIAPMERA